MIVPRLGTFPARLLVRMASPLVPMGRLLVRMASPLVPMEKLLVRIGSPLVLMGRLHYSLGQLCSPWRTRSTFVATEGMWEGGDVETNSKVNIL